VVGDEADRRIPHGHSYLMGSIDERGTYLRKMLPTFVD
jgi:hypothetical protein